MSVYFDASVLVSLFVHDPLTARAEAFLATARPVPVISDFAAAEFASAIARRVRTGDIAVTEARNVFGNFDAWMARVERAEATASDIAAAAGYLRRLDLTLRTPDAINLAIAARLGATLYTFDDGMAACARALGIPLTPP